MKRRTFLTATTAAVAAPTPQSVDIPIIDTHIHLFDTRRPEGVPWPDKNNALLYKPALPDRYRKLAVPHGIVGAIEVEASPWVKDNQWVLDVCEKDPIMVGTVGNLEPANPDFRKQLDTLHKNPLFRGIRCGNLWGRDLAADLDKPAFVAGLRALQQADLSLDIANPNPRLIAAVLRTSDLVPDLRIIVDHLPQAATPPDAATRRAFEADIRELGKRPQIYVKISEVLRRVDGRVNFDLAFYRPRLDELCGIFGEDRVLYGSDWPNSDNWAPYDKVFRIVHEYFTGKGRQAAEKYFWKNSVAAYRWIHRDSRQPRLAAA